MAPANAEHLRDFSFPLNVYARLLELEDGYAEYMHYGLFERSDGSAAEAQRRASDLLWQHLPPPCRLLDVGVGLGTSLRRLTDAGYAVVGVTPDAAQISFVRQRHGDAVRTECTRYEDFSEGLGVDGQAGKWDAILFQESAQYINDLDLFDQADRLLGERGEIIVMDEFMLCRDAESTGHLHYLEHFLCLAERFGFTVSTQLDLSVKAAHTVDWLLAAVDRNALTLQAELGVSVEQLAALNASNLVYREQYGAGRYGYFLLRLTRGARPQWLLGRVAGGQRQGEMRQLFADVFGHDMSPEHWQWKYGDGHGLGIGVWRTDTAAGTQMVAHYGGVSRDILLFGKPAKALQCGDVMVAEQGRRSLSRRGPVFLAAATCLEQSIGYGTPHLIAFGFPNDRAYRLPEQLGLYAESGRMVEAIWPSLASRPSLLYALREIDASDKSLDCQLDACWAAMAADSRDLAIGVRDASYLRHRYMQHPDKQYRLFALKRRFGGAVLGVIVLRIVGEGAATTCELLDAIGSVRLLPLLLHHARRLAASFGAAQLTAWLSDNLRPYFGLPGDAEVHDLGIVIPGNAWTPGPPVTSLQGRWWLTGGDADFR